jgi:hypothetical protein
MVAEQYSSSSIKVAWRAAARDQVVRGALLGRLLLPLQLLGELLLQLLLHRLLHPVQRVRSLAH